MHPFNFFLRTVKKINFTLICLQGVPVFIDKPMYPLVECFKVKKINGYVYGENENGGTNTIYVSPVPFEDLNKAIEKGKGKPHLKPVKDTMAQANNLTTAMVLAPVAGIAAAVGKFVKLAKNSQSQIRSELK